MKVIQIINEQPLTANDIKSAFTNDQWMRIIAHFMNTKGDRRLPRQGGTSVVSPDTVIRSELRTAFKRIGPNMDPNLTASEWNNRAVTYGANLDSRTITWEAIRAHLNAHKDAPLPSGFDPNVPLDRSTRRRDTDRTPETFQEFSTWINGPATMNRQQAIDYFRSMVGVIIEKRSWATAQFFANENNRYIRAWYSLQSRTIPKDEATIQKSVLDSQIYGWLTAVDSNLLR